MLKLLEKNRPRTHLAAHQEQKAWPRACIKVQLVRGQRRCQNDGLGWGPAGQLVKPPPEPGARAAGAQRPEASSSCWAHHVHARRFWVSGRAGGL